MFSVLAPDIFLCQGSRWRDNPKNFGPIFENKREWVGIPELGGGVVNDHVTPPPLKTIVGKYIRLPNGIFQSFRNILTKYIIHVFLKRKLNVCIPTRVTKRHTIDSI